MLSLRGSGSLENRTGQRRRSPAASHNEIIAETVMRNLKKMKLTNDQFEALAYIFEKENGNKKSNYELDIIANSGLVEINAEVLEQNVVNGLNNGIYNGTTERISAYWVLGKRFNKTLIPSFKKWLRKELELNDAQAVYQLLVSLKNMEEPVFNPDRDGGSASYETELNMRDAKDYLNKNSA